MTRSAILFCRNQSNLRFLLRRECQQIPSTEQLLHQTDKNSKRMCSIKFSNTHRKIPELESLFNKIFCLLGLKLYQKETPTQFFSCEYCKVLQNTTGGYFCQFDEGNVQYWAFAEFLRKPILKNGSELTLGSGCLKLCFLRVAFRTIMVQLYNKNTSRFLVTGSS